MKVLVVSDLHGNTRLAAKFGKIALDEAIQVCVICGDVTNFGTVDSAIKVLDTFGEIKQKILFVPGNCDPKELASAKTKAGILCIHHNSYEAGGYEFMGLGGSSKTPYHTPFELSETEIEVTLEDTYNNTRRQKPLVLVSHAPPKDTMLDRTKLGVSAGRNFGQNVRSGKKICSRFLRTHT